MTLPWHNPVLLAEQQATLALVSEGRLDFGVCKGYRYNEFHGFGVDMVDSEEIFTEALALILKSWHIEERWSHMGKHWQLNEIVVEPPTVQESHPPIWLASGRPSSIRASARRGAQLLLDQYSPLHAVFERSEIFRDELQQIGVDPQDR